MSIITLERLKSVQELKFPISFGLLECTIEVPKISKGLLRLEVLGRSGISIPIYFFMACLHLLGTYYVPDTMLNAFTTSSQQPCLTDEDTMAQRSSVTCPKSKLVCSRTNINSCVFWLHYTTLASFGNYFVLLGCTQYESLERDEISDVLIGHPWPLKQSIRPCRNGVWDCYILMRDRDMLKELGTDRALPPQQGYPGQLQDSIESTNLLRG